MHPQRRAALVSVVAAILLIALKLGAGLASHSLGLISEALHSGTDLVAALLTLFAVGVAVRPADVSHQYGHGKAEHLSALAEAAILVAASAFIAWRAITHLVGDRPTSVNATWYAFVVIAIVIAVDLSRNVVLRRASRRYHSAALASNALHFASDLAGSVAVLVGLVLVHAGHPRADAAAALFVAVLVSLAAIRLMKRNVNVLDVGGRTEVSLHLKLPGELTLEQAHEVANQVEAAIARAVPEVDDVQTHIEPLAEHSEGRPMVEDAAERDVVLRIVHDVTGLEPREVRFVRTDDGTIAYLTLGLDAASPLAEAHARASEIEERIRRARPDIADVIVHTEP